MNIPNFENIIPQGNLNKVHFVGNVLREVFGIQSPVYIANAWLDQPVVIPKYGGLDLSPLEESNIISALGTPVLGDITFEAGQYNTYNRFTGVIEKARYGKYTLPYSCIVDFNRQNNVITTPVLGGNGTVKELYGIGDWEITIRGIAFNNDSVGNSAHEQIKQLIAWSYLCDSIEVGGLVFLSKGIDHIVIKSLEIQPVEAKWDVIPFTIQAISDEPIELTI